MTEVSVSWTTFERYIGADEAATKQLRDLPALVRLAWNLALILPEAGDDIIADLLDDVRRIAAREEDRIKAEAMTAAEAKAKEFWAGRYQRSETRGLQRTAALATANALNGMDPHGYFVYLLWRAKGDEKPVYVGKSTNVLSRLGDHMTGELRYAARWISIIDCGTEDAMSETESRLIRHYQPEFNYHGNPRYRP